MRTKHENTSEHGKCKKIKDHNETEKTHYKHKKTETTMKHSEHIRT